MVYFFPPFLAPGMSAFRGRKGLPRLSSFPPRITLDPYEELMVDKRVFPSQKNGLWDNPRPVVASLIVVLFFLGIGLLGLALLGGMGRLN
jgi:hypothetical protein